MPEQSPGFVPFSLTHGAVVVAFVLATTALVLAGRRLRGTRTLRRIEVAIAGVNLACWAGVAAWWLMPERFSLRKSLPMELCDWAALLAPIVMLWPVRPLRAVLYFWGIGLSTQGFVTPTLQNGPGDFYFWAFWYQHAAIVGGAVYEVAARGYRPTWRDYWLACGASYAYLAAAMIANTALGANYGYVGEGLAATPTIVDKLGPWPLRVVWVVLLVHAVFAVATLPWMLTRGEARRERHG